MSISLISKRVATVAGLGAVAASVSAKMATAGASLIGYGASYTPATVVPEVSTAGAVAALTVAVGIAVLIYERRKSRSS